MKDEKSRTFVLVHGAWHGPWCWARVGQYLTARGHDVVCPQLPSDTPGAGRDEFLAVIDDVLRTRSDVVLVAHSMSGLVAPLAIGNEAVSSLVLLAGLVPRPGAVWADSALSALAEPLRKVLARADLDESGCVVIDPADATEVFFHDCTPADAADAANRLRPNDGTVGRQACPDLPERRVPVTYLSCREDRAADCEWNATAARELFGATVREIDGGHSPFWSRPEQLAELLVELA